MQDQLFDPAHFGERVRRSRTWRRWTQLDVSLKTGISLAHLCHIEQGKVRHVHLGTAMSLALAFGIGLDDLCGWQEIREALHDGKSAASVVTT